MKSRLQRRDHVGREEEEAGFEFADGGEEGLRDGDSRDDLCVEGVGPQFWRDGFYGAGLVCEVWGEDQACEGEVVW